MKLIIKLNQQDTKKIIEEYLALIFKQVEGLPNLEFEVDFEDWNLKTK